jgi:transcriptional regulator with PAS, ATPase and Fis domain
LNCAAAAEAAARIARSGPEENKLHHRRGGKNHEADESADSTALNVQERNHEGRAECQKKGGCHRSCQGGALLIVSGSKSASAAEAVTVAAPTYIGGSTIDRLPLQAAVRATAATYKSLAKLKRNIESLKEGLLGQGWRWGIIGRAPAMANIVSQIEKGAPTRLPVLILGENGTGKELVASALHLASGRRSQKMMVVNCAAIPRELLEIGDASPSEL